MLVLGAIGLVAAVSLIGGIGANLALPRVNAGPPQATDDFLRGNRDFDASLVWRSFSDDARGRLESQGGSQETLQRQMQAARERGISMEQINYIGGKDLPDGSSMQFYLVAVRQAAQGELEFVPYTFTLDQSGKIAKVQ